MASVSLDYDQAPAVLIFGDDAARVDAATAAAATQNVRVLAALPLGQAAERLEQQAAVDLVLVELWDDHGAAQDALLDRIEAMAADRLAAIVAIPGALIDAVTARITAANVQLLCDPTPAQRAAAVGLALAGRRPHVADKGAEDETERLQRLSEEVGRIARTLAEMAEREPAPVPPVVNSRSIDFRTGDGVALSAAEIRRTIRARRLREQYFAADLFADPAWDMLLDLLAARLDRQQVAVSSLCIAAAVPPTTALRWIRAMSEQGLFVRQADPHDARRIFIALADGAAAAMTSYFEAARKLGGALA